MIKNIITPIQSWLLKQKRCVGCGTPLHQGVKKQKRGTIQIICKCSRIYIFDQKTKNYRRAKLNEI